MGMFTRTPRFARRRRTRNSVLSVMARDSSRYARMARTVSHAPDAFSMNTRITASSFESFIYCQLLRMTRPTVTFRSMSRSFGRASRSRCSFEHSKSSVLTIILDFSFGSPNGALEMVLMLMIGVALGLLPAHLVIPLIAVLFGFHGVGRLTLVVKRRTVVGLGRYSC